MLETQQDMIKTLRPLNILLVNLYVIMFLQLFLNWNFTGCQTFSNVWALCIYILLVLRIVIDELHNNKIAPYKSYAALSLLLSSVMTGLGIYETVTIITHL